MYQIGLLYTTRKGCNTYQSNITKKRCTITSWCFRISLKKKSHWEDTPRYGNHVVLRAGIYLNWNVMQGRVICILHFNPLMIAATKSSLTNLEKSFKQKRIWENIWRRNVNQDTTNNSPSNILWNHFQFQSYCQKYYRSRQQFLEEHLSIDRLTINDTKGNNHSLFYRICRWNWEFHLSSLSLPHWG